MKFCNRCKFAKPEEAFYKNKSKKDGISTYCKSCMQVIQNDHYKRSPHRQKQVREINKRRIELNKEFIKNFLLEHPCVDCGNDNILVLDFDHVRGEKIACVSELNRLGRSLDAVKLEIEKCEVRCANCHRIKTHNDRQR